MYNFNMLGHSMEFRSRMERHIYVNPERCKDYICEGFTGYNPTLDPTGHPCWEAISQGIKYLKSLGWKVYPARDRNGDIQIYVESPDKEYYHSHYNYR